MKTRICKEKIKIYVKYVGNAISALSILFVLSALAEIGIGLPGVSDWRVFVLPVAAGVVLKTATVFLSASAWVHWLEFYSGKGCSRKEALRVYAKANIGKYMPGNVMHYVERNLFAGKLGLSQKQIAAASMSEVASLAFSAICMGLVLAFSQVYAALCAICKSLHWNLPLAAAFGVGALCIVPICLVLYSKKGILRTFFYCFCVNCAVLLTLGAILVLIYSCWVRPPGLWQAVQMAAAYMIAWVLGFIIPGAPGGIGIRELVLTLLLSPVVGKDCIVTLGVWHRLITVLGDFAAYFVRKWGCFSRGGDMQDIL